MASNTPDNQTHLAGRTEFTAVIGSLQLVRFLATAAIAAKAHRPVRSVRGILSRYRLISSRLFFFFATSLSHATHLSRPDA